MNIGKILWEKPKNVGFRFGFVAMLLVSIALIYPTFMGIGYVDAQLLQWTVMLIIGLLMSFMFSSMLSGYGKTKIDAGITPATIAKQMSVVSIGVVAGLILVALNAVTGMGIKVVVGSVEHGFFYGLMAGVAEELFFRGFIQNMLRVFVPSLILALIPTALIFALFHYFAYGLNPVALGVMFMLGIFLGLLHEIFNDVGVPMLAHVVNNVFAMLPAVIAVITGNLVIIVIIIGVVIVSYVFARTRR